MCMDKICDRICEKGSYSLSDFMYLTIDNLTFEYGTNIKFGNYTISRRNIKKNRLNTLEVMTHQTWKFGKAINPFSQIQSHM